MKNKFLVVALLFMVIFTIPYQAEAKFWGREETVTGVVSQNGCMYSMVNVCSYVMWINTGCTTEQRLVGCDQDGPDPCYPDPCPDI